MREILRSTDPVLLSFVRAVLASEQIESVTVDQHTSLIEGSIGIFPQRLLVKPHQWSRARQALIEADLGQWLAPDDGSAS
jgi:hypothetical protein